MVVEFGGSNDVPLQGYRPTPLTREYIHLSNCRGFILESSIEPSIELCSVMVEGCKEFVRLTPRRFRGEEAQHGSISLI